MLVTDTAPNRVLSWNQQTYQRLKLSLSLGLRRQLFVAVCDDLSLRDRLTEQLHSELELSFADGQTALQLVSLTLQAGDPDPLAQISQWFACHRRSPNSTSMLGFQILGVERLTRQSSTVQQLFLRRLQIMEPYLPRLDAALLLWLPRPWFYTIQQSVPEFWRWHTGIFEFAGEPTPLVSDYSPVPDSPAPASALELEKESVSKSPPPVERPSAPLPQEETKGSFQEDLRTLLAQEGEETDVIPSLPKVKRDSQPQGKPKAPVPTVVDEEEPAQTTAPSEPPPPNELTPEPPVQPETKQTSSAAPIEQPLTEELGSSEPQGAAVPDTPSEAEPEPQAESPTASADAYLELGHYYRHLIEQGDASEENLLTAIQAYEMALQFIDNTSPQLCEILNDVGNLYWMLSRRAGGGEQALSYLEQGIRAYQLALAKLIAEEVPHTYSMIQNNLGAAYGDLARYGEPIDALQQSIRAYEEALHYRSAQSDPLKYASTKNNLGTAYWYLAQHHAPADNLRAAIAAYRKSLTYYSDRTNPANWAMIQNNLGTAYWNLAQYDRQPEPWLEQATEAYREALKYRTAKESPAACAATQNNLGTAYWHLADCLHQAPERRRDYLRQCILAYEGAIALAEQLAGQTPPIPVNFDLLATENNLGLAHYQLATEPKFSLDETKRATHLEAALHQHAQVCTKAVAQSEIYQTALIYLTKTVRTFYQEKGINGQNFALSKVPGQLLPEILPRL
jgi:tetratricopeptide (TPR) repeat protein